MKIGLVSDIHLQSENRESVLEELSGVVDRFDDSFEPDVTVVLGDLIEDEGSADRDSEHVRAVAETLDDLDSPVTFLAGNHDVENLSSDELAALLDQDRWGRIDGTDLLYLDSAAPWLSGARGEVTDEQLAFLDDELDGTDDRLLFVHHPVHYHDLRDNYWFGETPERAFCGNKAEVNRVIEHRDGVLAVFNGHLHETDYTRYRGTHHFTVNAFGKERPESDVTGTYAEVTIDDRLTVRVVEGDRMTRTFEVPI
ncbi:metallophosphoesterase family protein [Halorussus salinisoli]|uniref:metallophosphoesterase family protein n=1 Tax=Halorussus salinisoli TaxID=2558242 RepID=UPI0010C164CE|nr:metallophosphoesterase [Halorussus salinisoli]